jgi:hypothetical protein
MVLVTVTHALAVMQAPRRLRWSRLRESWLQACLRAQWQREYWEGTKSRLTMSLHGGMKPWAVARFLVFSTTQRMPLHSFPVLSGCPLPRMCRRPHLTVFAAATSREHALAIGMPLFLLHQGDDCEAACTHGSESPAAEVVQSEPQAAGSSTGPGPSIPIPPGASVVAFGQLPVTPPPRAPIIVTLESEGAAGPTRSTPPGSGADAVHDACLPVQPEGSATLSDDAARVVCTGGLTHHAAPPAAGAGDVLAALTAPDPRAWGEGPVGARDVVLVTRAALPVDASATTNSEVVVELADVGLELVVEPPPLAPSCTVVGHCSPP